MLSIYDGRQCLYQWETGRALLVSNPIIERVLFSNITTPEALPVDVVEGAGGLRIAFVPDELLQTSWDINASAICGEGCTRAELLIPVKARAKPAEYVYTPTEVHNYNSLAARIAALEGQMPYKRKTVIARLSSSDFETVYDSYGDPYWVHEMTPAIAAFDSEAIEYEIRCKDPETGELLATRTKADEDWHYHNREALEGGTEWSCYRATGYDYGILILTGCNFIDFACDSIVSPHDAAYVQIYWIPEEFIEEVVIYGVESKKLSADLVDLAPLEEEFASAYALLDVVDEIAEEVDKL